MNDLKCWVTLGAGMIAGALLYKYSACAKNIVDQGEKKMVETVENIEQQAKTMEAKNEKKTKN